MRTLRRGRHREATMVAHELSPEAMVDQPGVTIRACEPEAALPAQRQRRVATTIEEQQRLLAALDRDLYGLGQPRCDVAPARRAFALQVDRLDRRQLSAT